ncbi:hypothetical protein [Rhizobium sp. 60-20]|uniref:hypothetical protein n=1 Tax=Rhizobium sp. 60-20 TaxID=1895819 RepID=UPI0009298713|nr:hypothetical protein [Rhizobium sp. 60-20]OJY66424.1 MAG: hypothetical protein BGP09_31345 [Rhizobium sp. 60-20]
MTRFAQVDMNAVAPLLPGDKVAGRVAARGEHFDFKPSANGKVHSDLPLRFRSPTDVEKLLPTFVDLCGTAIGRLKVMGIAVDITSTSGQCWVVRCVCGAYETRKAKYIKSCVAGTNPGEHEPMCDWCGKTRKLQMGIGVHRSELLVKIEGYK